MRRTRLMVTARERVHQGAYDLLDSNRRVDHLTIAQTRTRANLATALFSLTVSLPPKSCVQQHYKAVSSHSSSATLMANHTAVGMLQSSRRRDTKQGPTIGFLSTAVGHNQGKQKKSTARGTGHTSAVLPGSSYPSVKAVRAPGRASRAPAVY